MSEPFLGQISMFGFGFPPKHWALCNGQTLSVQQNTALFSLLGTYYGGNGKTTFNLPDLRGRTPLGVGSYPGFGNFTPGQIGGAEGVVLNGNEMPAHTHTLNVVATPPDLTKNTITCTGATLSQTTGTKQGGGSFTLNLYAADPNPGATLAGPSIGNTGGQPHPNLMPSLVISFCIALGGIFPSRN